MGELAIKNPVEGFPAQWQTNLVIDVAMGVDPDVICEAYDLQFTQLEHIKKLPSFASRLEEMEKELSKTGASFRIKAGLQAEEYLKTSFAMVQDPTMDPKIRRDLIEMTARWAAYDKPGGKDAEGKGGGFQININLGAASEGTTIEGEQ